MQKKLSVSTFFLLSLAWSLVLALPTTFAQADDSVMTAYFRTLEGHWSGRGQIHFLDTNGQPRDVSYDVQIQVDPSSPGIWGARSDIRDDHGSTSQNYVNYTVQGDQLFVSNNSPLEPVQIIEATPFGLTYKIQRADLFTGRIFVFTFQTVINAEHSEMNGHNLVETNGVTINDETYSARRW